MHASHLHHLDERCCIIGAWLELYFVIISIFGFVVAMHDKFGVLALSERWVQCICKKRIMLNKPRAVNFFKGSKLDQLKQENYCFQTLSIPRSEYLFSLANANNYHGDK